MDEVEEIKRRIDIIDLISNYLTLKKAGTNYKAICPFHQEKTPSMMVSAEKQIFKCFGCGEGGDIFSFVMKMENLEFREALQMLADRAGVKLSRHDPKIAQVQTDRKTKLYKINDLAARVFHKLLTDHRLGKAALDYLKDRKLTTETINDFQIGYAPSSRALKKFLLDKGFSAQEIIDAGSPDRFFKRIIFPIRDTMGHVVGFTGRVTEKDQQPKYLNTADTIIFHKSRLLYNLDQSKAAIKQENAAIVVEGQMDVIASCQAGIKNVVATSGTALTEEHLQIIYRYTPNIIFAFDSDQAGLKTAKKAYEMAIAEGMNAKMVNLGKYKDPGEMIADNPQAWPKAVKEALPAIEWYFDLAFDKAEGKREKGEGTISAQEKKEIAKEILPIIKIIPDKIEQAHYVELLSEKFNIKAEVIFRALEKAENKSGKSLPAKAVNKLDSNTLLLAILLRNPSKMSEASELIDEKDFSERGQQAIYKRLLTEYNNNQAITLKELLAKVSREEKNTIETITLPLDERYIDRPEEENEDFRQLTEKLIKNRRELLKSHYASEIKKAESQRDFAKLKELIKEFQDAISK